MFILTMFAFGNSVLLDVVKSESLEPKEIIQSALLTITLAALLPVTPNPPR